MLTFKQSPTCTREVEEARMDLQSIRDQIMHGKIHALKEEMDHKALVASMERHQEQEKVRERAKRIELETLKRCVLTMWNQWACRWRNVHNGCYLLAR